MPVNIDSDGRRWLEMEFPLPGTPEQVWQAIATGPGFAAWFVPAEVEGEVGGRVAFDMGEGAVSQGVVTTWEPPHRVAFEERDWNGEAPPLATELIVEAQSGGGCVVRLVHSLFASDDRWDEQIEGFEGGWSSCFAVLAVYLRHFAGDAAVQVRVAASRPGEDRELWAQMTTALGLSAANAGEHCAAPAGAPPFAGVIERVMQHEAPREVMVRLEEPCDGIAHIGSYASGEQSHASICLFLYGERAAELAPAVEAEWTAWLKDLVGSGVAAGDAGQEAGL